MRHSLSLLAVAPFAIVGCAKALAKTPADEPSRTELAIYKQDFALVSQSRTIELTEGRNRVDFPQVSNSLDPHSVIIQSDRTFNVLSTTFDMGVQDQSKLLERLAGKAVEVMLPSEDGSPGRTLEGVLEPSPSGGFLLRTGDKVYINPPGTIIASSEADVATMPKLTAEIESPKTGEPSVTVSYLSRGLSWSADYTASLLDEDEMQLELWATVTNETGVRFENANISFVAGEPNRAAVDWRNRRQAAKSAATPMTEADASVDPQRLGSLTSAIVGELHAYKAPGPATVGIDQMNRIPMMEKVVVPITRDYSVSLPPLASWGYQLPYGRRSSIQNAQVAIKFKNDRGSKLGFPLPAGAVRIYSNEAGTPAYVGAGGLEDTPIDTPVHLTLSNVFDVTANPSVIATTRIDKRTTRKKIRVDIVNRKKSDIVLRLVQPVYQSWALASESHKSGKLDSRTNQWKVNVPAGGETSLTFEMDLKN